LKGNAVSLTNRLFGRKGGVPQLDAVGLQGFLTNAVSHSAGRSAEPELVRARFADRCRDAGLEPLMPEEFDKLTDGLDAEAWGRLALLVGALDLEAVRSVLPALTMARPLTELVKTAFAGLARETPLLTLELLRQSPLRVEELARRFIAELGAAVRGESPQVSSQRLARLDYGQLLAEAERAKQAAAGRVEQLRKLQDEREKRRPRRGKW
jgi:hypothetical protein